MFLLEEPTQMKPHLAEAIKCQCGMTPYRYLEPTSMQRTTRYTSGAGVNAELASPAVVDEPCARYATDRSECLRNCKPT
jgi:hypothetical protein